MRSVTCINSETGDSITFSEDSFAPLFLAGLEGVYSASNNVTISDNTMTDGGIYLGSVANVRNIVITALDRPNNTYNQSNRDIVYKIFRAGIAGVFIYREDDKKPRKIDYYVESITRDDRRNYTFTISLLCPDPAFSDLTETQVYMANWVGSFEFEHEFVRNGEELGIRLLDRLVNIVNNSAARSLGFEAVIQTSGTTVNPSLARVESTEFIKIGSENKPFTLLAGDVLTITTTKNNKHVRVLREGATEEVEANEYLTEDSDFFQLLSGDNNIVYAADTGVDYMTVTIKYSFKYDGA